jgi:hypothetical protein
MMIMMGFKHQLDKTKDSTPVGILYHTLLLASRLVPKLQNLGNQNLIFKSFCELLSD